MKYLALLVILPGVLSPPLAAAEGSSRLKVSATIPPRPCQYPDSCNHVVSSAGTATATRVVLTEGRISYVGTPPVVEKKDDLLVVKF